MSNILTSRIIIIIITIISLSLYFTITRNSQQQIFAQTSASTGSFITYENSNYKFKIQYPSNWEKVEFSPGIKESGRNIIVNFISPQETFSDLFREYLIIEVQDQQSNAISLDRYISQQIDTYKKSLPRFAVIESKTSTTPNNNVDHPSHKIVYSYSDSTVGKAEIMEIDMIESNRLYSLSYHADAARYSSYLPVIGKMIKSFESIK
jgi:eukaryotic-like serine/threonine-protein kinase